MTGRPSLDSRYFDDIYARSRDPWRFRTSRYERDKYAATLEILPRPRFSSALEVGCSIGVFTRLLAARCDTLVAVDTSPIALAEARLGCQDLPQVRFGEATLPRDFPPGSFDLIVLSEVLYYLSKDDLAEMTRRCCASVSSEGHVVLCHWLGATDYPLGGDEAADLFIASSAPRLQARGGRREAEYRLDLLGSTS